MLHNPRMPEASPDAELMALIDRVGRRDETALRLLYERTSPKLFGLAMRVVRSVPLWRYGTKWKISRESPLA